jgi:hypothetical protein
MVLWLLLRLLIRKDDCVFAGNSGLEVVHQLARSFEVDGKRMEARRVVLLRHGVNVSADRLFDRFPEPELSIKAFGQSIDAFKCTNDVESLVPGELAEVLAEVFIKSLSSLLTAEVGVLGFCDSKAADHLCEPFCVLRTDNVRLRNSSQHTSSVLLRNRLLEGIDRYRAESESLEAH